MTPEFKAQWIEALRSGRYEQNHGDWVDEIGNPTKFCCLSVALVDSEKFKESIGAIDGGNDGRWLPWACAGLLQISEESVCVLMRMNDRENKSFEEIADWIEGQEVL